ncbi:hypothetical protein EIL87_10365 [Saccharopolyspora rhizosphaerae]|uniref:Uncharacterized protein n=1 Tax=Saccharopolyspora rhizosphaerae TaxID=2492662 RepID=A0A426JWW1_9PSEU|nr:hypothetical protein [Saccharopolyspora rhizosphaerae]RRO17665.1 hypothetical protein EIL87_10365 [Saccharopolyspora rhizosphaerae]
MTASSYGFHRTFADRDDLREPHAYELERGWAEGRLEVTAAWLHHWELGHVDVEPSSMIDGVRAANQQAVSLTVQLERRRQGGVGVLFDPRYQEVNDAAEAPNAEPGEVAHVWRPGYGEACDQPVVGTVNRKPR